MAQKKLSKEMLGFCYFNVRKQHATSVTDWSDTTLSVDGPDLLHWSAVHRQFPETWSGPPHLSKDDAGKFTSPVCC